MRAVLHGLLTVFAPLEAIVHDVHIGPRFDGISRLSRRLEARFLPRPVAHQFRNNLTHCTHVIFTLSSQELNGFEADKFGQHANED
jgi:hypothetical protein